MKRIAEKAAAPYRNWLAYVLKPIPSAPGTTLPFAIECSFM
jgi:hypothetical protein